MNDERFALMLISIMIGIIAALLFIVWAAGHHLAYHSGVEILH